MKRESVRVRLFQLLDLPFIETFVISPVCDKKLLLPTGESPRAVVGNTKHIGQGLHAVINTQKVTNLQLLLLKHSTPCYLSLVMIGYELNTIDLETQNDIIVETWENTDLKSMLLLRNLVNYSLCL